MVKIINGEIVADDDPRLRSAAPAPQPARQPATAPRGPAGAPPGPRLLGTSLDFSQPPFRVVDPVPGAMSIMNLPDALVFGFRVTALAGIAMGVAASMWGWRAALAIGVLYYVYQSSQGSIQQQQQQAAAAAQARGGAPAQFQQPAPQQADGPSPFDMLSRYMNGPAPPHQQRRQQHAGGPPAGDRAAAGAAAAARAAPAASSDAGAGAGAGAGTAGVKPDASGSFAGKGYRLGGN